MVPSSLGSFGPSGPDLGLAPLAHASRFLLLYLGWMVMAGLVAAGICWTCGYGYRLLSSWIGPPPRLHADPVEREAARGIRELELWLAGVSPPP